MTKPTTCTRHVFDSVVSGRPMSPADLELPRMRAALTAVLAGVYAQGDGPWSSRAYWDARRRVAEALDTASLRALAVELLRPHGWSDDDLRMALADATT